MRAELDRHVVPDELPQGVAQRTLRRRARRRPLRSGRRRCGASGSRRSPAAPGCATAARRCTSCSSPVDRRLAGRSSWLAVAREKAAQRPGHAVKFEDEPVPGYPLPILPGHTSPGRLERVLRAGAFAVTTELDPPDSADPGGRLSPRARVRRLRRRHQRDRRQRRQLPHVEPRRLRAADARRLRAGDADLVPRPEPHRDPGRHPGRRRDGRVQHAVPHRRRCGERRPSAGEARVRSRLHDAARDRPHAAR